MTLQDYLSREGLTFTAFAALIGTKYPRTVERYAKGQQIPDRTMMLRIVDKTRSEVMPNDFYGVGHTAPDMSSSIPPSSGNLGEVSPQVEEEAA
ncbi:hypothetical protein [Sphingobium sp. S8]|uniref:hypothetical protein n=1 Tax=Sphingobium sp. S8 TaxID=2758385 RepID=UPI00191AB01E|nr:hypothetical protein [Sphingobium sp. S8]